MPPNAPGVQVQVASGRLSRLEIPTRQNVTVAEGARAGDTYEVDGVAVGTITSVCGTVALAFVKRSALKSGA